MTIAHVVSRASATKAWADGVADALNNSVLGGMAIIENATTPAGTANELRWSTVHQAMMRWKGTQWVFVGGVPPYFASECSDFMNGFTNTDPSGATWGSGSDLAGGSFRAIKPAVTANIGRFAQGTPSATHPGTIIAGTGGVVGTGCSILTGITAMGGNPGLRFRGVISLPNIGATITQRVGFFDTLTNAAPTDGAFLEIINTTATFKTSQASTVTSNATTATVAASTWYTVHIWFVTTTTARCVVVKDDGTVVLDVTNVANVPSSAQFFGAGAAGYLNTGSSTSTMYIEVDWLGVGNGGV